jgi:hypothetical protein
VKARKRNDGWPIHQLLYDLHPIAKWLQYKVLACIDKGNAPVARLRHQIPAQSAWYVFQGITSNGKGQPILSKAFVVGKSFSDQPIGNMDNFDDFVKHYRLFDSLPTVEIEPEHLQLLQTKLPEVVTSAIKLYKHDLQGNLADEIEDKLKEYETRLNNWLQSSERQLTLNFGLEDKSNRYADKRRRDIEYLHKETQEFYQCYFQLENEPYLRLLAVFYNL